MIVKADIPAAADKIKLAGLTLAPGLMDRQVNGGGGNINMVKQVHPHEVMITFGMIRTKAAVFVQVEGPAGGEIKSILSVETSQMGVDVLHGPAGGES